MECLNELEKRNKFVSLSGIIKFDIQRMLHGCKKERKEGGSDSITGNC